MPPCAKPQTYYHGCTPHPSLALRTPSRAATSRRVHAMVLGPPGLRAFERAARPFMRRDFFALHLDECGAGAPAPPSYADSVTVAAAPVHWAATLNGASGGCEVSYTFTAPAVRGKFDASAAGALGVPAGPLRGKLHGGQSVTLPDGSVVTPAQVCDACLDSPVGDAHADAQGNE